MEHLHESLQGYIGLLVVTDGGVVEVREEQGCDVPDMNWFAYLPDRRQLVALWGRLKLAVYNARDWEESGIHKVVDNIKLFYQNHPEVSGR
jgi:hypothetical protein